MANNSSVSLLLCGLFFFLVSSSWFSLYVEGTADYKLALSMSLKYFEAQRSGPLPPDQRVTWRSDSALKDGSDGNVDLVGGYYDSGDNVKFGFPMAFAMTTLAWGLVEFSGHFNDKGELGNALKALRWGTDYLLKASATDGVLYGQVGEGFSDHACWMRSEDMTTPRLTFKIDATNPGTDLAAETAAALAAASIVFSSSDLSYSSRLLDRAEKLHDFARDHLALYSESIGAAKTFYPSSGYNDEKLWAAAWLYRASHNRRYLDYLSDDEGTGGPRTMCSWDDKFLGAQVLVSKFLLDGDVGHEGAWQVYYDSAVTFFCNMIQKGENNFKMSQGGMLWWGSEWNNLQYTTAATLALTTFAEYLSAASTQMSCPGGKVWPDDLFNFAISQVNYILGMNPRQLSYMVGYGPQYPKLVHHRDASMPSIKTHPQLIECKAGYADWFNNPNPNPNVLVGAVLGGPDLFDQYSDSRSNYQQAEPAIANTGPIVGVLARLT